MFKLKTNILLLQTYVSSCFSSKPKKYHWYQVRYIYNKNGLRKFDFVDEIGLSEQKTTLNKRKLKKICTPLHKLHKVKKMLDNGNFDVEILCYLGWFSK
jgi:hypothetical protein